MQDSDLLECLRIHPKKMGTESIGTQRAYLAWQKIHRDRGACGGALLEMTSLSGPRIVAFGIAAFVTRAFADAELSSPAPGLNMRVITSVDAGRSVIASRREIVEGNTRGDLQQVIFYANWHREVFDRTTASEARHRITQAYAHIFAGFRIARVIAELADDADIDDVGHHPGVVIVSRFNDFFDINPDSPWNRDRALAVATVDSMRSDSGSLANAVFLHQKPLFGFTEGEQMLLEEALEGFDDEDSARHLCRTVAAIKRRWALIFQRVAAIRPDLCPLNEGRSRGIQKRGRILAYVRDHPEELRPFNFSGVAAPRRAPSIEEPAKHLASLT